MYVREYLPVFQHFINKKLKDLYQVYMQIYFYHKIQINITGK